MIRFVVWLLRAFLLLLSLMFAFVLAFAAITTWMLLSGRVVPGQTMYGGDPAPATSEAISVTLISMLVIVVAMGVRRWLQSYLQRRRAAAGNATAPK